MSPVIKTAIFAFIMYMLREKKRGKQLNRTGPLERAVLEAILPQKAFSLMMIYWAVDSLYPKVVLPKEFSRTIKKMVEKRLLFEEMDKKAGEPLYFLTENGLTVRNYINPLDISCQNGIKAATILVTPEKAANETELSVSSIRKKRTRWLHHLTIDKKIYVLKKIDVSASLLKDIPTFPVIKSLLQMTKVFPDPPHSVYRLLGNIRSENGTWLWPDVLNNLLEIYGEPVPEHTKNKEVNNANTHQGKRPEAPVRTEVSSS